MNIFFRLLLGLICINFCYAIGAHRDAKIIVDESGVFTGLPKQYSPAFFDLNSGVLSIGLKKLTFPKCLGQYLPIDEDHKIWAVSSWYHTKRLGGLPNYIRFSISHISKHNGLEYSIWMLLNLDELKVIKEHIGVSVAPEKGGTYMPLSIDKKCLKEIDNSVKTKTIKEM